MKPIAITIRRRGVPARRIVGLYAGTAHAVAWALDLLDQEGATEAGRISAEVLA